MTNIFVFLGCNCIERRSKVIIFSCFYFNKNASNGRTVAGVCVLRKDVSCNLLVTQFRSPVTRLSKNEILLQNRAGKGMPYIMAILDDIVTGIIPVIVPPETDSPDEKA